MSVVYSLVIPVYKNAATLPQLMSELETLRARLDAPMEVVFVVDGSPDDSYLILKQHCAIARFASQLVVLSRNFGSFAAIRMGLAQMRGEYAVTLSADLQEPVSLAYEMFITLRQQKADITIGQRTKRGDAWPARLCAALFWSLYRRLVQREVPAGGVDVFGVTRQVRDLLLSFKEANTSLVGLLFWVGFRRALVPYERAPRPHGKSAWSFRRKLRYVIDSAFAFSDLPISFMIGIGLLAMTTALGLSVYILIAWLLGLITVPGYTAIMLAMLWMFATVILSLGIIGAYLWRAFENTKQRPTFIPLSIESFH